MAETVLVTVTHSTVLDEPHDISGGGQPARKKSDTGSKSPGDPHTHTTHTNETSRHVIPNHPTVSTACMTTENLRLLRFHSQQLT